MNSGKKRFSQEFEFKAIFTFRKSIYGMLSKFLMLSY